MSASTRLESSTEIIQVAVHGPILRISFSGIYFEGVGRQLSNALLPAIRQHQPAAVILDFLQFRYRGGNDFGEIVEAFVRRRLNGKVALRPCAILATGSTSKSLMSLFVSAKLLETFDLSLFEDLNSATEHLRKRLESPTP